MITFPYIYIKIYKKFFSKSDEYYVKNLRKRSLGFRNQVSEFDRKRIQTVRLTLTIVICNFFLWTPFCIGNVVQAFAPELLCKQIF